MDIKKTFRLTEAEHNELYAMMKESGEGNLSNFIRQKLFESKPSVSDVCSLAQEVQKINAASNLEKIFLTLYQIQILCQATNQIEAEKMAAVMACFRELLAEAEQTLPLSSEFKEKWL